jgi:DNA-binding MarR family transcriptional regulator
MTRQQRVVTLISLLRRTSQRMVDEITERLEAAGYPDAPPSFHPVFENIDPGGTRLTVLAARAGLTHQSVGEVVSELQRLGYVERTTDPYDARARLVRLTGKGRTLVKIALREIAAIEAKWYRLWREAGLRSDLSGPLEAALQEDDMRNREHTTVARRSRHPTPTRRS